MNESENGTLVPLGRDYPELRDGVKRICQDFPLEYWARLDRERAYPTEFVKALTEAGYLAALIPEEYGGAGLPLRAAAVILEEINRNGGNATQAHAQMYVMGTVLRHGSEEQKRRILPRVASGELRLQAFGVTEPTSGSDTTRIRTTAVRQGDEYVINGQKVWTSRALHSDLMLLLARTTPLDQVQKRTHGLSVFIVDLKENLGKTVEIRPIDAMINHNTTEVFFENLRVPVENRIGEEGQGFKYILSGMNAERILVATELVGDTHWFIETATRYANERVVFGRPIGQNQGIQFPIARCYAELECADILARRAAALFQDGKDCGTAANVAKLIASEASWHAAEACMQTFGGFGYAAEYHVERRWREARLAQIAPVSTNMVLSYIAQHVLGLPRSY